MSEERQPIVTEIDGIPAVILEREGPVDAGIMFRAGRGDDPIPKLGITHLIEHLAVHGVGELEHEYNAMVSHITTTFVASGSIEEVTSYLAAICKSLSSLPAERIARELRVLSIESSNNDLPGPGSRFDSTFGTSGLGTADYPDFGASSITIADVEAMRSRFFTRENAVLFFTQTPPADFKLELQSGQRQPAPPSTVIERPFPVAAPAWGKVGMQFETAESHGLAAAMSIFERRLSQRLRSEEGLTYTVSYNYIGLNADRCFVFVEADVAEEASVDAWNTFIKEVQRFADSGPTDQEREWQERQKARQYTDPDTVPGQIMNKAEEILLGFAIAESRPSNEEIHAAFSAGVSRAIYSVPASLLPIEGLPNIRYGKADVIVGKAINRRLPFGSKVFTANDEGFTFYKDGEKATILWAECRVVQEFNEGQTLVISGDGTVLLIEPNELRVSGAKRLLALLHANVSHDLFIPAIGDTPVPVPKADMNLKSRVGEKLAGPIYRRLQATQIAGIALSILIPVFYFLFFVDSEDTGGTPVIEIVLFLTACVFIGATGILAAITSRLAFVSGAIAVALGIVVSIGDRTWQPVAANGELVTFSLMGALLLVTWFLRPQAPRLYPRISTPLAPSSLELQPSDLEGEDEETVVRFLATQPKPIDEKAAARAANRRWLGGEGSRRLRLWQGIGISVTWLIAFAVSLAMGGNTDPVYSSAADGVVTFFFLAGLLTILLPLARSPYAAVGSLLTGVSGVVVGFLDRTYDPANSDHEIIIFALGLVISLVFFPWRRRDA